MGSELLGVRYRPALADFADLEIGSPGGLDARPAGAAEAGGVDDAHSGVVGSLDEFVQRPVATEQGAPEGGLS